MNVELRWTNIALEFHLQMGQTRALVSLPMKSTMNLMFCLGAASVKITQSPAFTDNLKHEMLEVVAETMRISDDPLKAYKRYVSPKVASQPWAMQI
jgi:hypothetical protein